MQALTQYRIQNNIQGRPQRKGNFVGRIEGKVTFIVGTTQSGAEFAAPPFAQELT